MENVMKTTTTEIIACDHEKKLLLPPQIKTETMTKQLTVEETMKGLADANREFNALRNSMPKAEWERRLSAALREMQ
jgi:hypothetical protein